LTVTRPTFIGAGFTNSAGKSAQLSSCGSGTPFERTYFTGLHLARLSAKTTPPTISLIAYISYNLPNIAPKVNQNRIMMF
jgi:hypothetical protein